MQWAGMDVGFSRPMVLMPFWSRKMFSRPLTLRLGVNIWEQWLLILPVLFFQGVAVELVRLLNTSPWTLYSSSAKSASEFLRARKELKMLFWLPLLVLRGWEESVASRGWKGRGDRGGYRERHKGGISSRRVKHQKLREISFVGNCIIPQVRPQAPASPQWPQLLSPLKESCEIVFFYCWFAVCFLLLHRMVTALGTQRSPSPVLVFWLPTSSRNKLLQGVRSIYCLKPKTHTLTHTKILHLFNWVVFEYCFIIT